MSFTKQQLDAYIQALYDDDGQLSTNDYQLIINYILSNGEPETDPRDLIQFRRGNTADLPILAQGEPAFTLDGERFFIGGLNGNVPLKQSSFENVLDYGAVGDGIEDNFTVFKTLLESKKRVYIPAGTYKVNNILPIEMLSNSVLLMDKDAVINLTVSESFVNVGNVENVVVSGGHIVGNSTGLGGKHAIYFTNSDNVVIENIEIEESSQHAIKFVGCTNSRIQNCNLHNNYRYGIESIEGVNNLYIHNRLIKNGYVGLSETYIAGGRGITVWKEKHSVIIFNEAIENSEYGIRIYSESADSIYSENNKIISNYLKDNGDVAAPTLIDIYLYSEGSLDKLRNTLISFNSIERTRAGTMINAVGIETIVESNFLKDINDNFICSGILLYGVQNGIVKNNIFEGVGNAVQFSGSVITNETIIKDNIAKTCKTFINAFLGNGNIADGNKAVHGGSGTSDYGISNSGTNNQIKNNVLDGFKRGINFGNGAVIISGNRTLNSTEVGLFKNGDDLTDVSLHDNYLESAFPGEIQGMTSYKNSRQRRVTHYNVAPVNLTWDVGDIVFNRDPVASGFVGWVCVTAGTPGTWKTFGVISA